jgi:hypothetical protein
VLTSTISSPTDSTTISQPAGRAPIHEAARGALRKLPVAPAPQRAATDDEILGIGDAKARSSERTPPPNEAGDSADASTRASEPGRETPDAGEVPEALRAALETHPELQRVWDEAEAYRETFATPEAARAATAQIADLHRLDALFFSRRPEDHAELARAVAGLDPVAFASLAQAMAALTSTPAAAANMFSTIRPATVPANAPTPVASQVAENSSAPTSAQVEFFHAANDAAVRGVLDAIESQVERLLPEGISKSARNRVVGEIYRELDTTLSSNRELGDQMRHAFRNGSLDAAHQRAIVSLVNGRARQALPGVARRVLSEWTSTLVAANHDRRARQRAAERRVDIAGASGGNDGRRSMTPRDLDYNRLSDSDILNM